MISKLRDMEEEERVYDSRLFIRDFTDARVHLPYSEFGAPSRLITVANPTAHFPASSSTTRRRLAVRVRGVEEPNGDGDVRCEVEDETGSLTATVGEDMTHWYVWKRTHCSLIPTVSHLPVVRIGAPRSGVHRCTTQTEVLVHRTGTEGACAWAPAC